MEQGVLWTLKWKLEMLTQNSISLWSIRWQKHRIHRWLGFKLFKQISKWSRCALQKQHGFYWNSSFCLELQTGNLSLTSKGGRRISALSPDAGRIPFSQQQKVRPITTDDLLRLICNKADTVGAATVGRAWSGMQGKTHFEKWGNCSKVLQVHKNPLERKPFLTVEILFFSWLQL